MTQPRNPTNAVRLDDRPRAPGRPHHALRPLPGGSVAADATVGAAGDHGTQPWILRLAARAAALFRRVEARTSLRARDDR